MELEKMKTLWQWDTGQQLLLQEREQKAGITSASMSVNDRDAVLVSVVGDRIRIPDLLLQSCGYLKVYLHAETQDSLTTIFAETIYIYPRPKPNDYVEPDEVLHWHQLDERITALEQGSSTGGGGLTPEQAAKLKEIDGKVSKTGHGANKYLGTDAKGNVVEKDAPASGGGGDGGNPVPPGPSGELPDGSVSPNKTTFFRETARSINLYNRDTQQANVAGLAKIYLRFWPTTDNLYMVPYCIKKITFASAGNPTVAELAAPIGRNGVQTESGILAAFALDVPAGSETATFVFDRIYTGTTAPDVIITDHELESDAGATEVDFDIVEPYCELIAQRIMSTEASAQQMHQANQYADRQIAAAQATAISADPEPTENIFDYTDMVEGLVQYSAARGIHYITNSMGAGVVSSKPLPCKGGTAYHQTIFGTFEPVSVTCIVELDEYMAYVKHTQTSSSVWPHTTDPRTRYMILPCKKGKERDVVVAERTVNYYIPAIRKVLEPMAYLPEGHMISGLAGLRWNALGDSWTADYPVDGRYRGYVGRIAEKTGIIARNYGISGSTVSTMGNGGSEPMCVRYTDMDPDADLVTIMGGINDHNSQLTGIDYGEIGSQDPNTFYGGWNVLLDGIRSKYPNAIILVFTNGDCTPETRGDAEGRADAILKVCRRHRIPCCDILHGLGFGYRAYNSDMVHLKPWQQEKCLTPIVYNFIRQHFMP